MKTIKGPAIFLAQFASDHTPFNKLDDIARWASNFGDEAVQIQTWAERLLDLKRAVESKDYSEGVRAVLAQHVLLPTELSTHLQGQLAAVHPAYDAAFNGF